MGTLTEVADAPELRIEDLPISNFVGPDVEDIIRQKIPLTLDEELIAATESMQKLTAERKKQEEDIGQPMWYGESDVAQKWLRSARSSAVKYHMLRIFRDPQFRDLCDVADSQSFLADEDDESPAGAALSERRREIWRQVCALLEQMRMTRDHSAMERQLRDAHAWLTRQRTTFVGRGCARVPAKTKEFYDFCADADVTQMPGSARYVSRETPTDGFVASSSSRDTGFKDERVAPIVPRVQLPPARERLHDFETHKIVNRPLTARKLKTMTASDSPEPGERPFTPSTATGGYSARTCSSARSTPVPFGNSRPNSALSYGRPATVQSPGRPGSALAGSRQRPRSGLPQRPRTATGAPQVTKPTVEQSMDRQPVAAPVSEICSVHDPPTAAELSMQERWLDYRNREVANKMVGEEQRDAMQNWAERRARVEEEIIRNTETARFQSELWRRGYSLPADTHEDVEASNPQLEVLDASGRSAPAHLIASSTVASSRSRPDSARAVARYNVCDIMASDGRSTKVSFEVKPPSGAPKRSQALTPRIAELRRLNANLLKCADTGNFEDDESDADSEDSAHYEPMTRACGECSTVSKPDRPRREDDSDVLAAVCDGWRHRHGADGQTEGGSNFTLDAMRFNQQLEVEQIKRVLAKKNIMMDMATLESSLIMPAHKFKPNAALYEFEPNLPTNPHAKEKYTKKRRAPKAGRKSIVAKSKSGPVGPRKSVVARPK